MKNILLTCAVLFFSVIYLTCSVYAQQEILEEAYKAAENGLEEFKVSAINDFEEFGYESSDQFQKAEISWGYNVYNLNYDTLLDDKYKNIMDITEKTNTWEFVVTSKGKAVSFLTVEQNGDNYMVTGFGGNSSNLNGIYNRTIKNKNVIAPIILKDIGNYYILYNNPSGQEIVIPVSNKEFQGKHLKSKVLSDGIKTRINNHTFGMRGNGQTLLNVESDDIVNNTNANYTLITCLGGLMSISIIVLINIKKTPTIKNK